MFTSGLDGRAAARGFSPAVASRHTKFRIPGGAFLSCMGFLGIPQGVLVAVLVAVSRSLLCAWFYVVSPPKTRFLGARGSEALKQPRATRVGPHSRTVSPKMHDIGGLSRDIVELC